jgi:RND family efflux transporter MFP subunit
VAGRIDERLVDVGEMVGPGSPIARLIQVGVVKISAGIPERYVDGVKVGMPVTMTFDALGNEQVSGRITYVGGTISKSDRTLPIEIELPNRGGRFKPEMVAELGVRKDRLRNVIVIPRTALVRTESGWQVYLAVPASDGDGYVVEPRDVTLGPTDKGSVVVESGVMKGEYVITVGQNKVNPGEQVHFDL